MATKEEIGLALQAIEAINSMNRQLRNSAANVLSANSKITGLVSDQIILVKLRNGLIALEIDVADVNTDRQDICQVAQYVLANLSDLARIT